MNEDLACQREGARAGLGIRRYAMGRFVLDPVRRVLTYADAPVSISSTLFDTLLYLVEHPHRVVTKHELLDSVWANKTVEEANVSQTIFALRKALASSGATERLIVTAPRQGYRLAMPVVADEAARPAAPLPLAPWAPPGAPAGASPLPRWRLAAGLVMALGLAAASLGGRPWAQARPGAPSLVVLADFQNFTADARLDKALDIAAQADLRQPGAPRLLADPRIAETLGLMARRSDTPLTPAVAREICERNNGQATIGGAVAQIGALWLLTMSATGCASGQLIASGKAEVARREDLLPRLDALVDRLRGDVAAAIPPAGPPLQAERTASLDALKAYSAAMRDVQAGKRLESLPLFRQAIALDPHFTMAYADLAAQYDDLRQGALAKAAMRQAYDLRALAGPRDGLMLAIDYDDSMVRDEAKTLTAAKAFTELYPNDAFGWLALSNQEDRYARYQAAIAPGEQAVRLDPEDAASYVALARALLHDGRLREAAAVCDAAKARHVDGDALHGIRFEIEAARDDDAAMARDLTAAAGWPEQPTLLLDAGRIALGEGRVRAATALFARAFALDTGSGMSDAMAAPNARLLADIGFRSAAPSSLSRVPSAEDSEDYRYTLAEIGDAGRAEALLRGDPRAALADLHEAGPYDLHTLDTPYARGQADLAAADGPGAATEFARIIAHRFVEPLSEHDALAWLGLARALRLRDELPASRAAYAHFLGLWRNADPDVPILLQAKAEFSALKRG